LDAFHNSCLKINDNEVVITIASSLTFGEQRILVADSLEIYFETVFFRGLFHSFGVNDEFEGK
jgi:hypothetical protein